MAAQWTFATSLLRARLDYLADGLLPPDARGRLAAYLLTEARLAVDETATLCAVDAVSLRALAARMAAGVRWPEDPRARLSVVRSLPRCIVDAWCDAYGEAVADALGEASNAPGPITLRAASPRVSRAELARYLAEEGIATAPARFAPHALRVVGAANLWGTRAWREARFEVQDEGSQLVALAAAVRPGETVVDVCAGRGGKTLALLGAMTDQQEPSGQLHALDVDAARLQALVGRVRRVVRANEAVADKHAGLGIVRVSALTPEALDGLRARADVVLVDGPCSELGTLRREPDRRWRVTPEELAPLHAQSVSILQRARALVRPGGRMGYATCTLRREENEDVAAVVDAWPGVSPWPLASLFGAPVAKALRADGHTLTLFPHVHGTDGFFIASWRV